MNGRAVRPYSSSLRSEQAEQTRDRIVLAAVDLLSGADAGDLSMNEVAGRAGVSVRTVYRNFATREALLDGVVGWVGDQVGRRVGPPPSTSTEYVETTPKVITALFEVEPLYRALFATTTGRESHRRTKGARLDDIQRAFATEIESMDEDQAQRFAAVMHLVSSSNGALFMKDYWGLDADEIGQALQWAIRTLADAARPEAEEGAVTVTWEPPGGGWWQLEEVHVRGWQPRVFQERAPEAFKVGFRGSAERYGLPIDYLDMRFVNDHCYVRMRALGEPEPERGKSSSPPPAIVLKVMSRVHPGLRRRAKSARAALAERRWRADRQRWEAHQRGAMLAAGRALQAEPIESFDDDGLLDHLGRVGDHFARGTQLHFELVPVHNVPVGRFLLACRGWAIPDGHAMALLAGSSGASAGSTAVLAQIAAACRDAGVEPTSLEAVRSAGAAAAVALDDYLADHAWRMVTQYTPRGLALIEIPDVLLQAIRSAAGPTGVASPDPAPVRARVPEAERDRFDELLADARDCYGNRDDNVALTFMWPVGLMRRVLLEVGRRLTDRRVIEEPTHALALGSEELAAALHGDGSMGAEAAARMERMSRCEAEGAPAFIGDPEGGPPDMAVFPPAMAEVTAAMMAVFELEGFAQEGPDGWSGTGVGIGIDRYEGRACVAASPEEALTQLEPGDVLVTSLTTPAFEAIMAIAGAVVTEHGGLASHTALVAREQGIPAVVGVAGATATISSGAHVVVDPAAGRVTVSPRPART